MKREDATVSYTHSDMTFNKLSPGDTSAREIDKFLVDKIPVDKFKMERRKKRPRLLIEIQVSLILFVRNYLRKPRALTIAR